MGVRLMILHSGALPSWLSACLSGKRQRRHLALARFEGPKLFLFRRPRPPADICRPRTAGSASDAGSPLPPHAHVAKYVPFSALFKHVAAIVHNGGVGTMSQALRAGVPQVRRGGTSISLRRRSR